MRPGRSTRRCSNSARRSVSSPITPDVYLDLAECPPAEGRLRRGAGHHPQSPASMGPKLVADPWHSAEWLAKIEPMAALAGRLPAILKGKTARRTSPSGSTWPRSATTRKCMPPPPGSGPRPWTKTRSSATTAAPSTAYNAACSAALAAAGQDKDEPPPDDAARADLRRRALGWLKAELAAWSRLLASGPPQDRDRRPRTMQHWRKDADLAAVRDADALAKLPEAERRDWLALWDEVDALIRKAGEAKPR